MTPKGLLGPSSPNNLTFGCTNSPHALNPSYCVHSHFPMLPVLEQLIGRVELGGRSRRPVARIRDPSPKRQMPQPVRPRAVEGLGPAWTRLHKALPRRQYILTKSFARQIGFALLKYFTTLSRNPRCRSHSCQLRPQHTANYHCVHATIQPNIASSKRLGNCSWKSADTGSLRLLPDRSKGVKLLFTPRV